MLEMTKEELTRYIDNIPMKRRRKYEKKFLY